MPIGSEAEIIGPARAKTNSHNGRRSTQDQPLFTNGRTAQIIPPY
jgi:hypothetical protein